MGGYSRECHCVRFVLDVAFHLWRFCLVIMIYGHETFMMHATNFLLGRFMGCMRLEIGFQISEILVRVLKTSDKIIRKFFFFMI